MAFTGGATGEASPYPHLYHDLELAPNAFRRFTWVLASLEDDDDSFRHARLTAAQNWEAEIAKIKMLGSQGIEIETGDAAAGTVLWLHGLGADAHDFEPVVPMLELVAFGVPATAEGLRRTAHQIADIIFER